MFKKVLILFGVATLPLLSLSADCPKCEKIRKYHDEHPEENYTYFEDYLKDKEDGKAVSNGYSQDESSSNDQQDFIVEEDGTIKYKKPKKQ